MDFIFDRLAIGDACEARHPGDEITALLGVAQEIDIEPEGRIYQKIPIRDMTPIPPEQLGPAVEWIRAHVLDHRILVFCNAGVGRSSSVVVGYLYCVLGYGFGDAVEVVAGRRPGMSILPNLIVTVGEVRRRMYVHG